VNNIRSTLTTVWRIAAPYFRSEDKLAGRTLLVSVILLELVQVAIDVLMNQWNNRFYNALTERNWDNFLKEIGIFSILAFCSVGLAVYQLYLNQWLQIRWRSWMTSLYLGQWLHDANHYRMQLQGDAADNPDQRITDDVKLFVERTLNVGLGLLNSVVTLASFVIILWGLSAAAPLIIFGWDLSIPGYLVWAALVYSVVGTALTQWIGSPLVNLDFQQQRFEADFRFNLVRVRENSEQIALLRGEGAERQRLSERFGRVVGNWYAIMSRTKRLTAFTAGYAQTAAIFPSLLVAPAYYASKIELGAMVQTASAFSSVQGALSFFVSTYRSLAEWRAVIARLDGFEMAIASATTIATGPDAIDVVASTGSDEIDLRQLLVRLPNGSPLVSADGFSLRANHRSVRRRQIDLVPCHCRHLAVRGGLDRHPCKSHADDAAAAAVFSGRIAAGSDRLSCGGEHVQFGSDQGCAHLGRAAGTGLAAGRRSPLEPDALARRAAASRSRPRAAARPAISVSR
jgi:vitamin B12/bleomycin/antimicrobial peptide transport system ATP-binding/permease protein